MNGLYPRLALYSDQYCVNRSMDERLLRLMAVARPRIGYVASAPDPQRVYFDRARAYYAELGAELALYIDSETEFPATVMDALAECDAIHLSGGNTFAFSHWLKTCGLLAPLRRYARGKGVLIGVSAGAILMTSCVETAALCGDVAELPLSEHESLGLVQFGFWPHYTPGAGPGEAGGVAPRVLYACPDGAGVVIDGPSVQTYGAVAVFDRGR